MNSLQKEISISEHFQVCLFFFLIEFFQIWCLVDR